MKVAPVGLIFYGHNKEAFKTGCEISAITHGHPSGYLSAGFLASVIADIANGLSLMNSIKNALTILQTWNGHEETTRAVEKALVLYRQTKNHKDKITPEDVEQLGGGWVAEEVLAVLLYASVLEGHPLAMKRLKDFYNIDSSKNYDFGKELIDGEIDIDTNIEVQ